MVEGQLLYTDTPLPKDEGVLPSAIRLTTSPFGEQQGSGLQKRFALLKREGPVPVCPTVQSFKLKRDKQTVRSVLRSCPTRQDLTRSLILFCSLVNTLVLLPMGTIYHGTRKHSSVVKVLDAVYHTCQ